MKNKAINSLTYTGIVTLSQYIGSKKIKIAQGHNTGGSSLYRFLANCLVGDFTSAKVSRPTKIKILRRSSSGSDETSQHYTYTSVSGFIFLNSLPEIVENESECRVRYSFVIPRDLFENSSKVEELGLGLYTHNALESEPGEYAAYFALSDTNVNKEVLLSSSLLVDWELVIANSGGTTSKTSL